MLENIKTWFGTQHLPNKEQLQDMTTWKFWRPTGLPAESQSYALIIGLAALAVVLLIIWAVALSRRDKTIPIYKPIINEVINLIVFIVFTGGAALFFRTQQIQYLSGRLMTLVIFLFSLGWLIRLAWLMRRVYPEKAKEHLEKERFLRYLPKKNVKNKNS